jgi:hypothetical protein
MLRALAVVATSAGLLLAGAAPALAADFGHVSGYEGPGYVSGRVASSPACPGNGPRFTVTNYRMRWGGDEPAKRDSGPIGSGRVCVTQAAFDRYGAGAWYPNTTGTRGPVG